MSIVIGLIADCAAACFLQERAKEEMDAYNAKKAEGGNAEEDVDGGDEDAGDDDDDV